MTTIIRRLTKQARREQLLDVAADLIVDHGTLTMEGLAEAAGVSKALPYQHFDDADHAIITLAEREIAAMRVRVLEEVAGLTDAEEAVRAAVRAYFDALAERGQVLAVLTAPGSPVPGTTDGNRRTHWFVTDLITPWFGLTKKQNSLLADFALGVIAGAVEAWAYKDATRRAIEDLAVTTILAAADSIAAG